ncbi:MAG: ROK family protein [Dongiaceae bacterium]
MRIGIDLGGTKTELIALDRKNGKELYRHRVPTPKDGYQAVIENIATLVNNAEETLGKKGSVGIGIPGTISRDTGKVKNANLLVLNGKPLDKDLEALLKRPIRVANDANCFAVSEAHDGAGAGAEVVFGVIIGTGCGGGVVVRGQAVGGINGVGGEWGHNPIPWPNKDEYPGPACYCGRSGCIEKYLSGTGFKEEFQRITGRELSTHDIIAHAENGDTQCEDALQRYEHRMAKSLAHIINVLDPDVIVLGGGMSNVARLYANVPKIWGKFVFTDNPNIPNKLLPARHGDSSGVRGAAWLWDGQD